MHYIGYAAAALFGLLIGSFLNVCIYRLPRSESVVTPRSHCPHCKKKIPAWENIPVISFIMLRGRCSGCHERISWRYPAVELLAMALSIACWHHFAGVHSYLAFFLLLAAPMVVVIFVDLEHLMIPDVITLPGIVAGLFVKTALALPGERFANLVDGLIGAVIGGGFLLLVAAIYERLRNKEGLGGGDVKLMAMLGAFFGWQAAIFILFLSSFIGAAVGLVVVLLKKGRFATPIPFGPFLAAAGLFWMFFGYRFLNLYLGWILRR